MKTFTHFCNLIITDSQAVAVHLSCQRNQGKNLEKLRPPKIKGHFLAQKELGKESLKFCTHHTYN
jgi:hypothetical protein